MRQRGWYSVREPMTKAQRHQHILNTAKQIFQHSGYDNVTIADVIKASNIARGTFYLHFESLESLLTGLFEDAVQTTWSRIDPILSNLDISFEQCTMEVIHAVFAMFQDDPMLGGVFYSGGGEEFLRRKQQIMFEELGGRLVHALEFRHQTKVPNLDWTVTMLISLIGDMSYYQRHISENERAAFEQHAIQFALAGMRGHLETYVPLETLR